MPTDTPPPIQFCQESRSDVFGSAFGSATIWRDPQQLRWSRQTREAAGKPADWPNSQLQMTSDLGDGLQVVGEYLHDASARTLRVGSLWKKKKGVAP